MILLRKESFCLVGLILLSGCTIGLPNIPTLLPTSKPTIKVISELIPTSIQNYETFTFTSSNCQRTISMDIPQGIKLLLNPSGDSFLMMESLYGNNTPDDQYPPFLMSGSCYFPCQQSYIDNHMNKAGTAEIENFTTSNVVVSYKTSKLAVGRKWGASSLYRIWVASIRDTNSIDTAPRVLLIEFMTNDYVNDVIIRILNSIKFNE
jgi:hypothetical protein